MERVRKAVIMARGLGTRMRKADESAVLDRDQAAAADAGVKAMIPIGRPFLDYVLGGLADAGFAEICLVIGPEHGLVRDYYRVQAPPKRVQIDFAVQEKPLGTADAVLAAKSFAGSDLFMVLNSDNYYHIAALHNMSSLEQAGVALFDRDRLVEESNIPEERILKFAVAKIDNEGYLERIFEKPGEDTIRMVGFPVYVSMNCWVFSHAIFEACLHVKPSARGELELTDAVQYATDVLKERYKALIFPYPVLDMSSRSDIAAVADRLQNVDPNP
jgi:dTDP-glucose pyrophosphorylase